MLREDVDLVKRMSENSMFLAEYIDKVNKLIA